MTSFDTSLGTVPFAIPSTLLGATPAHDRGWVKADLEVQLLNVEGDTRIKVTGEDGQTFFVPAEFLEVLKSNADYLTSMYHKGVNEAQFSFVGGMEEHGLVRHPGAYYKFVLASQALPSAEGVPYIQWNERKNFVQNSKPQWVLLLNGANTVLGSADWNDVEGFKNLVASMSDPESLVTFLGMADPAIAAVMAANMNARSLKSDKSLPSVTIVKAREVLASADLKLEYSDLSDANQGVGRLLQIRNGDAKIRVAVALQPAHRMIRPFTREESRGFTGMNYRNRYALEQKLIEEFKTDWKAKAAQAFLDAGWLIPELPKPLIVRNGRARADVLWVTPFDAETWGKVSLGAKIAAESFVM